MGLLQGPPLSELRVISDLQSRTRAPWAEILNLASKRWHQIPTHKGSTTPAWRTKKPKVSCSSQLRGKENVLQPILNPPLICSLCSTLAGIRKNTLNRRMLAKARKIVDPFLEASNKKCSRSMAKDQGPKMLSTICLCLTKLGQMRQTRAWAPTANFTVLQTKWTNLGNHHSWVT